MHCECVLCSVLRPTARDYEWLVEFWFTLHWSMHFTLYAICCAVPCHRQSAVHLITARQQATSSLWPTQNFAAPCELRRVSHWRSASTSSPPPSPLKFIMHIKKQTNKQNGMSASALSVSSRIYIYRTTSKWRVQFADTHGRFRAVRMDMDSLRHTTTYQQIPTLCAGWDDGTVAAMSTAGKDINSCTARSSMSHRVGQIYAKVQKLQLCTLLLRMSFVASQ